ncbi:MAG: aminotransferase class V-fold PLP-dependent enzyme [Candidatus Heimdallarchaeota archaeon]|nr:aminotransferase class V-fold PLP-dependent enzyme [Candidatus Heimdallarchaeota archaeon]
MAFITRFGEEFTIPEGKIYLDSATMGKMPVSSLDKMISYYKEINGAAVRSMSQEASAAAKVLRNSRNEIRNFFNSSESHVSFLPTREIALTNALFSLDKMKERKIISSMLEEHSLLAPAIRAHNTNGTKIHYLAIEEETSIIQSIQENIEKEGDIVLLSSLTVTNGVIRDWAKISKLCKDMGALLFLDISQTIGHELIDFSDTLPDLVISSGCIGALGPQGTAFQITNPEMYENMDPLLVGGGSVIALEEYSYILETSDSKFEPGIINVPGIAALSNSLKVLSDIGLEKIQNHEKQLDELLRKELRNVPNITLMEIEGAEYGPIISFGTDKFEAHDVAMILEDTNNIISRSGALCSHLFMYEQKYKDLVRISTHLYNSKEEIRILLEVLTEILSTK